MIRSISGSCPDMSVQDGFELLDVKQPSDGLGRLEEVILLALQSQESYGAA